MRNDLGMDFPIMKLKDSFVSWTEKWFYLAKLEESNLFYAGQPVPLSSFKAPPPEVQAEEVRRIAGIKVLSRHQLSAQDIIKDFLENHTSILQSRVHPFYSIEEE